MKRKNKIGIIVLLIVATTYSAFHERQGFSAEKAANYATTNAESKSRNMCALYIACALNAGGQPVPLLRGCDYKWYFDLFLHNQFKDISVEQYNPQIGDIVVFPKVPGHPYGHIAMWNGEQWVSDFKQRNIIVSKAYDINSCSLYRPQTIVR